MKPNRSRIPTVTLLLIGANIAAAWLATLFPDLVDRYSFHPGSPGFRSTLFSLFLHQNVAHLLGNMVFLAAVGSAVELAAGAFRFLTVYLLSGLLGVLAHFAFAGPGGPALIGASGCVAGCATYYAARYFNLQVALLPGRSVSVGAMIGVWVALQALGSILAFEGRQPAVSYWAHLGGALAGALLALIFRAPELGELKIAHEVLARMNERSPGAAIAAAERHLKTHPGDINALESLLLAAGKIGDREMEAKALFSLIEVRPKESLYYLRLAEIGRLRDLAPSRRALLADQMKPESLAVAEALLLSLVEEPVEEPERPQAMLALAELKGSTDAALAARILKQLETTYPMSPEVEIARRRGLFP